MTAVCGPECCKRGFTVLNFVVLHLKEERAIFEPLATQIISSLRFPAEVAGVLTSEDGFPCRLDMLPSRRKLSWKISLTQLIGAPTMDKAGWTVYRHSTCAKRQTMVGRWQNMRPSPALLSWVLRDFKLVKGEQEVMLGILPYNGEEKGSVCGEDWEFSRRRVHYF